MQDKNQGARIGLSKKNALNFDKNPSTAYSKASDRSSQQVSGEVMQYEREEK